MQEPLKDLPQLHRSGRRWRRTHLPTAKDRGYKARLDREEPLR